MVIKGAGFIFLAILALPARQSDTQDQPVPFFQPLVEAPVPQVNHGDIEALFSSGPPTIPPVYDASQQRQLQSIALAYAQTARDNYQMIAHVLGAAERTIPKKITILITYRMQTKEAGAMGDLIRVNAQYALDHSTELGLIVHELTHIVQRYPDDPPTWLLEGIADYVRYYHYEPVENRPVIAVGAANAEAGYKPTAVFLDWVVTHHDPQIIVQLNKSLVDETYSDDLWQKWTGESLPGLEKDWKASIAAKTP